MPRRVMLLLVCAVLATLWTPPQSTAAQTTCPEGGCKVFLPVVSVPEYLRIADWYVSGSRYCLGRSANILVENVGQELVTGFRIRGYFITDDDVRIDFDESIADSAVYPGGIFVVYVSLPDCGFTKSHVFQVSDVAVTHKRIYSLNVLSTDIKNESDCSGNGRVIVSGQVCNDTAISLSVLAVHLGLYGPGQVSDSLLAPGEVTQYTGSFYLYPDIPGVCLPQNPVVTVRAWGEAAP